MTIEEKRRELFEAWADGQGYNLEYNDLTIYESGATRCAWSGFNAALDAVVIEFVGEYEPTETGEHAQQVALVANCMLDDCRDAIESTGLGLKVLP